MLSANFVFEFSLIEKSRENETGERISTSLTSQIRGSGFWSQVSIRKPDFTPYALPLWFQTS